MSEYTPVSIATIFNENRKSPEGEGADSLDMYTKGTIRYIQAAIFCLIQTIEHDKDDGDDGDDVDAENPNITENENTVETHDTWIDSPETENDYRFETFIKPLLELRNKREYTKEDYNRLLELSWDLSLYSDQINALGDEWTCKKIRYATNLYYQVLMNVNSLFDRINTKNISELTTKISFDLDEVSPKTWYLDDLRVRCIRICQYKWMLNSEQTQKLISFTSDALQYISGDWINDPNNVCSSLDDLQNQLL